ncbi:MAG: hypothetical protein ACR2GU_11550 [Rubrobacteraceae bacterium]
MIALAAFILISGCSSNSESPREKANEAVAKANDSIAKHNKLFEQSRNTYNDVKTKLESGKDPSDQKKNIAEAKNTLEKARSNLKDARKSLKSVQNMNVDKAIKKYTSLLSTAMDAQTSAEGKEIQFYSILEKDPTLKDNRKKAEGLLSEISKDYKKSRESYKKVLDFAKSNPNVITLPPNTTGGASTSVSTSGSSTISTPSTTNSTTVGGTT